MRLPTVNPGQLRDFAADGVTAAQRAMSTAPRLGALLDAGEALLERVTCLVSRIEQAEARAATLIDRLDATQSSARSVVEQANDTASRVATLLGRYESALHAMSPAVVRMSETFSRTEIEDLITVIRLAPRATRHFTDDIVPVVETLKTIAPDLTELLATSRTLNEIIGSVPGLGRVKKRVDDELQQSE